MRTLKLIVGLVIAAFVAVVIYIYSSPTTSSSAQPSAAPAQSITVEKLPSGLVLPVQGVRVDQLTDTWGQAREGGKRAHQAIDIMAPGGTLVLSALPGTVEKLFNSARGGITAYVRTDDGQWTLYYAHLQGYAAGLAEGQHLKQGQVIGYVGDTGDAGPGNTHLHFAINRMAPGERWWQGTAINPYPILAGQNLAGKPAAR
ncbi:MAG TPA: M23 family metallopeptidase [Sphingomonas sp.]|nr:M23 family metallopeptidase [Sphingomonas sp.]